ncbi:hypothetical protein AB0D84_16105, partial [Streptomyces sp. NPDC048193]
MAAEQHPGGPDALMAAITGEPLPPGSDADVQEAHRSATADVALLREQLAFLGQALGRSGRRSVTLVAGVVVGNPKPYTGPRVMHLPS